MVEGLIERRLGSLMRIEEDPGFRDSFQDLVKAGQRSVLVGAPHESHFNGIEQAFVAARLLVYKQEAAPSMDHKGYVLLVASSVRSGHQSRFMQMIWGLMSRISLRKGLELVSYTRKKDRQYGLKPSVREIKLYAEKVRAGADPATFPEASVQAGRHPAGSGFHDIFGMQRPTNKALLDNHQLVTTSEEGKKMGRAFFVPVAHHGGYNVYNPHRLHLPTGEAFARFLGLAAHPLVKITIGRPISEVEIETAVGLNWRDDPTGLNNYVMGRIAAKVPPQAQGQYRDLVSVSY